MHRNEKGFTLMELMVVIVIVAILAAVAVPLYINYVKDAQRTEAKAAVGAIATAEQTYYLRCSTLSPDPANCPRYASLAELTSTGLVQIDEVLHKWQVTVTPNGGSGYVVQAQFLTDPTIRVQYTYILGTGGTFADNY